MGLDDEYTAASIRLQLSARDAIGFEFYAARIAKFAIYYALRIADSADVHGGRLYFLRVYRDFDFVVGDFRGLLCMLPVVCSEHGQ